MSTFAEWEARQGFPTVQAAADALGVQRRHIYRLREGQRPSHTLRLLMIAVDRLRKRGEAWPPG